MRSALIMVFIFGAMTLFGQVAPTPSSEAIQLRKIVLEHHLEPRLVDNDFSSRVIRVLLEEADPERLYFIQPDIDKLMSMHDKIDNDLNSLSWVFFPLFAETYEKGIRRAEKILVAETSKPFDLQSKETGKLDTAWSQSEAGLQQRWRLYLKDNILYDVAVARKSKSTLAEKEFLAEQEPISRNRISTAELRVVRKPFQQTSGFQPYALSMFYNAVARVFDPHTVYFSTTQMENFISSLSTEGFYFGFSIRENDGGEIEISNLLPGGPAWKSGEFNSGDVIEKLRWEGKEWMELVGVTEQDVDAKLSESNQEVMEFLLRKPGGLKKSIKLKKEKLDTEESLVRGFVLEGKRRIGYISLPDFYSSWGDEAGSKSAGDVAEEILKLKKQNIDGLILDVRFNGGGSLAEAVNMTGIFIEAGPVGIERIKGQEAFTLKDQNRGIVYEGPLTILINSMSASASEFLAAALQDYRRGIIVGSNTFGKGTAQEMYSLRPGKPDIDFSNLGSSGWGFIKVTTGKTYRINGKSIQKFGVVPDISLPDLSESFGYRESDQLYSLPSDSVNKKTYWTPLPKLPLPELKEKSHGRVSVHPGFKSLTNYTTSIRSRDLESNALDWNEAKKNMELQDKLHLDLKSAVATTTESFLVKPHDFGKPRLEIDEYAEMINNAWIKNLSQDISLEEAYNIICDYIDILNQN
jgi:carboxyl-terminal processing protease